MVFDREIGMFDLYPLIMESWKTNGNVVPWCIKSQHYISFFGHISFDSTG